ncbi:MAG: hypothetical protein PHS06_04675 [Candidatus Shapirobacteria bacterium]|nr:hypothetical protein [Candidatus Shapirobacteria bacterium]
MPPIEMYLNYPGQPVEVKKIPAGESLDKRIKDITVHIEGKEDGGVFEIKHDSQSKPKTHKVPSGEKFKIKKTIIEKGSQEKKFTLTFKGK